MKAVAMKFREKKFRAFYRIYILPMHIPNRKGAVKKAMEEEFLEHQESVVANGLQDELAAYIAAQVKRQDTYDAMVTAKSLVNQEPSEKNGKAVTNCNAAFALAKAEFLAAYH